MINKACHWYSYASWFELYLLWKLLYSSALWRFTPSGSGWESKNAWRRLWAHTRGNSRLENGSWKVSLSPRHKHVFWARRLYQEKKMASRELTRMQMEKSEQNLGKISGMLTVNAPCYILLYMIGNVIIAADGVLNFPIKENLYWSPLSWPYVNSWAGPRAPSLKQG